MVGRDARPWMILSRREAQALHDAAVGIPERFRSPDLQRAIHQVETQAAFIEGRACPAPDIDPIAAALRREMPDQHNGTKAQTT